MSNEDFCKWRSEQSQAKTKKSALKLADIAVIKFTKGSFSMDVKSSHADEEFINIDFAKTSLKNMTRRPPKLRQSDRGVTKAKKDEIILKLCPFMPPNRQRFWKNLAEIDCPAETSDSDCSLLF